MMVQFNNADMEMDYIAGNYLYLSNKHTCIDCFINLADGELLLHLE